MYNCGLSPSTAVVIQVLVREKRLIQNFLHRTKGYALGDNVERPWTAGEGLEGGAGRSGKTHRNTLPMSVPVPFLKAGTGLGASGVEF